MKRFFFKLVLFLIPFTLFCGYAVFQADGYTDAFYVRFTTPTQKSMILGTSRAAQGIVPSAMSAELGDSIFNFAFTIAHSPYGPYYFEAILKKLDHSCKNGIFILAVDPWSIAAKGDSEDRESLPEKNTFIGKMHFFNANPNTEYLVRYYEKPFARLAFYKKKQEYSFLHKNGWLEINVPMDSNLVSSRSKSKLEEYRNHLKQYKFSGLRLDYLQRTIKKLKEHGSIMLVRLPVHKKMVQIDDQLMPSFDSLMNTVSKRHGIQYYNMIGLADNFQYTDGNHLYKESSRQVSRLVSHFIADSVLTR